ncbi:MAG TPA: c-type cytochrome [Bacillus bacterium]|nr:c-type cytochrome [Bacillus sp. (in: firmicutes)]
MKNAIIIFLVFALVGFGGGYLFSQSKAPKDSASPGVTEQSQGTQGADQTEPAPTPEATASPEGEIFNQKGCIACHSIEKLGVTGGATGPDLSHAYENVEGKHGKPIAEFLKEPTSAVMASVIGGNPLSDDEINKIVEALKIANEK